MIVGISVCELHVPSARSLKHKRKVVRSLIDRIFGRFRASVAETDFHDLHQRAQLGLAIVTRSESDARKALDAIRALVDRELDAEVVRWDVELLEGAR